jgi:hypothetical protein
LNVENPTYCRLGKKCSEPNFYYQAIQINASSNGSYTIASDSTIKIRVYAYRNSFNSSNPGQNLASKADDRDTSSEEKPSQLKLVLHSQYISILVVTTEKPRKVGQFAVTAIGPGAITFL